jgi:CO/xanthine dehydrogenase Mo-binding subunit
MHGAVAMGVGAALTEQQVYDDEGHLHCSASRRT